MTKSRDSLSTRLYKLHEFLFYLADADSPDEICRRAVVSGREAAGVDRIGIWFVDPDDPTTFLGSYGIDESGELRDERLSRITLNRDIYDDDFLNRKVPYKFFPDAAVYDDASNEVGTADLIVAPLWNGNESIGALSADNFPARTPMTEDDRHLVALLARMVAHMVTMKRTEKTLRENAARLHELATTDEMTGFLNRRTGMQNLEHHISIARRNGEVLTVCFLDVDHLKRVNDEQGHARGDLLIRTIAGLVKNVLRESDIVCRMGGDEFMVVLPGGSRAEAGAVMERLLDGAKASSQLASITGGPWFSYGLAEYDGAADKSALPVKAIAEQLINRADMEMYFHKRSR